MCLPQSLRGLFCGFVINQLELNEAAAGGGCDGFGAAEEDLVMNTREALLIVT